MKIAVIGGGAAGMAAAVSAAAAGAKVVVMEKNQRLGKKILATGNGRCNFTNVSIKEQYYVSKDMDIVKNIIRKVGTDAVLEFFKFAGLEPAEEQGRIYPRSFQASALLDCLRNKMKALGVDELTAFEVINIKKQKTMFVISSKDGRIVKADRVIVCAGGCAYPNFGTDGSIYKVLENMGHTIVEPYPALVPLLVANMPKQLQGIRVKCDIRAKSGEQVLRHEKGEVQFTEYGLSGIAVMQCSYLLNKYKDLRIALDLFPEYENHELYDFLKIRRDNFEKLNLPLEDFFTGILNKSLGKIIFKFTDTGELSKNALHQLKNKLKNLEFEISGTKGYKNAQVSGGGLRLLEFNKDTMESLKIEGLYCAGEVLDCFGDCGGYNLHWAWASGIIAGNDAGEKRKIYNAEN